MFCWGFANSLIFPEASVLTGDTSLSPVKTALKCFPETADVNDDEDEDVRAPSPPSIPRLIQLNRPIER